MEIRMATTGDIGGVSALWHAGWHQGHAAVVPAALVATRVPSEFDARVQARIGQTYVALDDGMLAGFYMIDADELYQFYVDAAFQGKGTAAALMASAEAGLAGKLAWLGCAVGNDRAAAFYTKAGWRNAATQVYPVETATDPMEVSIWRFEKDLR